ncbi:hypothetical protein ACTA71_008962 [Dictyostelium dimigraforme]
MLDHHQIQKLVAYYFLSSLAQSLITGWHLSKSFINISNRYNLLLMSTVSSLVSNNNVVFHWRIAVKDKFEPYFNQTSPTKSEFVESTTPTNQFIIIEEVGRGHQTGPVKRLSKLFITRNKFQKKMMLLCHCAICRISLVVVNQSFAPFVTALQVLNALLVLFKPILLNINGSTYSNHYATIWLHHKSIL